MQELPPVVGILAAEDLARLSDPKEAYQLLKGGLLHELKRQAQWTFYHYAYPDHEEQAPSGRFVITPSGALNPLAASVGCDERDCRTERARTFARTVGLWADEAYVPDVVSMQLLDPGRLTLRWADQFALDVAVLREILPLIKSGVVRFGNPAFNVCGSCTSAAMNETSDALARQFEREFQFAASWQAGWVTIEAPAIIGESIVEYQIPSDRREAMDQLLASQHRKRLPAQASHLRRELIAQLLRERLSDVFLDLHSAQQLHSVLVSGTRTDVLCVSALEDRLPALASVEEWEHPREVRLPWISNLSIDEVIRLRGLAASALPRFREKVVTNMISGDVSLTSTSKLVAELRADAAEVEAELKALGPKSRRRDKTALAIISAGMALYGFGAAGVPGMSAVGQLVTTLGMIHGYSRTDHAEEAKLKSRPGYVLLKARELVTAGRHGRHAG